MDIYEASRNYNIPMEILRTYERWGLCSSVKKVMGGKIYRYFFVVSQVSDIPLGQVIYLYFIMPIVSGHNTGGCLLLTTFGTTVLNTSSQNGK